MPALWKCVVGMLMMAAIAVLPVDVHAVRALENNSQNRPEALQAMGSRPVPRKHLSNGPGAAAPIELKKVEMRNIRQAVSGIAREADAVRIAEQVFRGATVGAQRMLEAPFGNGSERSVRAVLRQTNADDTGNRHVRVAQTYQGIPVVGAEVIVHINTQDTVYRITGKYLPGIDLSVTPGITAQAALELGMHALSGKENVRVQQQPELVIFGRHLAYHYIIAHDGATPGRWQHYIDAHSGKVISRYNDIQSAPPTGTGSHKNVTGQRLSGEDGSVVTIPGWEDANGSYYLYNYSALWRIYDVAAVDWELDPDAAWEDGDPAAVSCANNLALVQEYVSDVLGRDSFDNEGAFAQANVHYGDDYVNAFWDGTDFSFGDGNGFHANELTVLDIVAHEFGHALTQYASDLVYAYESGALNEGYSDIFGTLVEFWAQPDGTNSYPDTVDGHADWLMGEDCWLVDNGLRDMRDPLADENPSVYHGTYFSYGWQDNGGVHYNATVLNKAFYLLSEGGTGENDGWSYDLFGIGVEAAGEVAMHANLNYHTSTDGFMEARQAWMDAAEDLSIEPSVVEDVFEAVGVSACVFVQEQPLAQALELVADQDFETANDDSDVYLADDFTLDTDQRIRKLFFDGILDTAASLSSATSLMFSIYNDDNGKPAGVPNDGENDPVWSLSLSPDDNQITLTVGVDEVGYSDLLLTLDSPVRLPAGTYWLIFHPQMDLNPNGQYFRITSSSTNGQPAQVINPGGGLAGYPTQWGPITDIAGVVNQDLAFTVVARDSDPDATYSVTFVAGAHGRITGPANQTVAHRGDCAQVRAVPDKGYRLQNWKGTGGFATASNPLTLTEVTSDMEITANFVRVSNRGGGGGGGGGGCFIDSLRR